MKTSALNSRLCGALGIAALCASGAATARPYLCGDARNLEPLRRRQQAGLRALSVRVEVCGLIHAMSVVR